ncbi:putative leader peptide [Streptomyces apocyni]|uniref:putative leader peptide n=1 Tax=Streptomyces apocyni TaxID=2654677 RepID=UPI00389A1DFA
MAAHLQQGRPARHGQLPEARIPALRHPGLHGVIKSTLSHDAGLCCPNTGLRWTESKVPCHASVMSRAGIALVSRRHVDLGRMSSAICSAG